MLLTSTSDIIKITTSSTADLHVQAGWADITTTAFTPGRTNTIITSATTTTVVAAPGASTQRQVKTLRLYNAHATTSNTVTIIHYDGTSNDTVYKHALLAGESISYDGSKWVLYDSTGTPIGTTQIATTSGSAGQVLQSNGAGNIPVYSTPTYPSSSGTARKILVSDGTNNIYSTETYAVPGTSGNILTSDGTNWTSAAAAGGGGRDAYTTTATAAGTTTLTSSSNYQQYFTGVTTQTVVLPVTSTLSLGYSYRIVNNSTGTVTVQSSGANNIIALIANTEAILTCILTSGTSAASWDYQIQTTNLVGTGTGQVVRATSPTLVTPALGTVASGVISACTSTSMAMVTPILGTPTSGTLTNCTGLPYTGVTKPTTVFYAHNSAGQALATATATKITLDTEDIDAGSLFASSKYTPNVAGKYLIIASICYGSIAAGTLGIAMIYQNGGVVVEMDVYQAATSSSLFSVCVGIVSMNGSTDYIEMYGYHNAGVNKSTLAGGSLTYLAGSLIERT